LRGKEKIQKNNQPLEETGYLCMRRNSTFLLYLLIYLPMRKSLIFLLLYYLVGTTGWMSPRISDFF